MQTLIEQSSSSACFEQVLELQFFWRFTIYGSSHLKLGPLQDFIILFTNWNSKEGCELSN